MRSLWIVLIALCLLLESAATSRASCAPPARTQEVASVDFVGHVVRVAAGRVPPRATVVVDQVVRGDLRRHQEVEVVDSYVNSSIHARMVVGQRYRIFLGDARPPFRVNDCRVKLLPGTIRQASDRSPGVVAGVTLAVLVVGLSTIVVRRRMQRRV